MGRWKNLSLDKEILTLHEQSQTRLANTSCTYIYPIFLALLYHDCNFPFSSINTEFIYLCVFWERIICKICLLLMWSMNLMENTVQTVFQKPESVHNVYITKHLLLLDCSLMTWKPDHPFVQTSDTHLIGAIYFIVKNVQALKEVFGNSILN